MRDPAGDPLAKDRRELKEYLLGPDEPTSRERFDTAVGDLALKAEARNVGQESLAVAPDDMPDGETDAEADGEAARPETSPPPDARVAEGRVPRRECSGDPALGASCDVEHGCRQATHPVHPIVYRVSKACLCRETVAWWREQ